MAEYGTIEAVNARMKGVGTASTREEAIRIGTKNWEGMSSDLKSLFEDVGQLDEIDYESKYEKERSERNAEKERADKAMDEMLKASQMREGIAAETLRKNEEALGKVTQEMQKQKELVQELNDREKAMSDQLLGAKTEIDLKDQEILELQQKLQALEDLKIDL